MALTAPAAGSAGPARGAAPSTGRSSSSGGSSAAHTFAELAHALQDPGADISLDALSKALIARIPQLRTCGEPDPAPSKDSLAKLDAAASSSTLGHGIELSTQLKQLAAELSPNLALDELTTASTLAAYTRAHAIALPAALSEHQKDELGDRITEFHFHERLAKIQCIQSLFLIAETENHPYQSGALDVLAQLLDDTFGARCIRSFTASTKRRLPPHVREITAYASFWATQQLKEQLALLELAFTFFRNRPALAENVSAVIDACKDTAIGRIQANQGFFSPASSTLQHSIRFTLVLLMVVTLDLDAYSNTIQLPAPAAASNKTAAREPTPATLAEDPALIRKAIDFLDFDDPDLLQGPFMLAWALVIRSIEDALSAQREASGRNIVPEHLHDLEDALERDDLDPIWKKLSSMALDPQTALFPCLHQIAASPLLAALPIYPGVALAPAAALHYRSTLKRLVLVSVQLVRPEYLPDFEALVAVLERICSPSAGAPESETHPDLAHALPKLCLQFWLSDLKEREGAAILDTARRRWPASFRPLLRLLHALSGVHQLPTGGLSNPDDSPAAAEALSSAITYFVNLSTLTFPLPVNNPVYGAFWKVVSGGPDGSAVYEAIRPIPVLGNHTVPTGSTGVLISQEDSAQSIALWSLEAPTSGWVLLRDFLLALIPGADRRLVQAPSSQMQLQLHSRSVILGAEQDNVFEQGQGSTLDFYALAPASSHESMEVVVSEAMDLFGVALASSATATALLDHLRNWDGDEPADQTMEGSVSRGAAASSSRPLLSTIAISLLHNALRNDAGATRCIASAYRLLAALVPHEGQQIWSLLRSADLIPSTARSSSTGFAYQALGAAGPDSHYHLCDRLLASEIRAARFGATLALLDLLLALSAEVRASHLAADADVLETQSARLGECVRWVFGSVWAHFQGWSYADAGERLLLAQRCLLLFNDVLDDPSLRLRDSPTAVLGLGVERLFVTHADVNALRPLLLLLNGGHAILAEVDPTDQLRFRLVENALTAALIFAGTIVERAQRLRKEEPAGSGAAGPGNMVLSFFESGNVTERLGPVTRFVYDSTASAVMAYAVSNDSHHVSTAALLLLQAVVRAAADAQGPDAASSVPAASADLTYNLVAHLGSTATMAALRTRMADILENAGVESVQRELWRLLAVIAGAQPALASLLLSNGHDLPSQKDALSRVDMATPSAEGSATKKGGSSSPSILAIAAQEVKQWETLLDSSPRLLEAVLQLLSSIWLQRSNLQSSIGAVSDDEALWKAVRGLALSPTSEPEGSEQTAAYCYRLTCKAAALDLFASEILYRCASMPLTPATRVAQGKIAVFKEAVEIAQSKELVDALASACSISVQPGREGRLQALFKGSGLGVPLAGFWRPRPDEPFNQLYGDGFKYDGALLLNKLDGIVRSTHDAGPAAEDLDALFSELLRVNNELSTTTAQRVLLWGWTHFLDALTLHKTRMPWVATPAEQERTLLAAFVRCAELTVSDSGVEGFMADVNRKRIKLLQILLKASWDAAEELSTDAAADGKDAASVLRPEALANTVKVVELCQQLVAEPSFANIEAHARFTSEVWASLHQDVLSIVGLCGPKVSAALALIRKPSDHAARAAGVTLGKAAGALRRYALNALATALKFGLEALQRRTELGTLRACHEDIALITSVLSPLLALSSSGGTAALLQEVYESGAVPLAFELIQRAPVLSPILPHGTFDVNGQEEVWLFAQPLLSFVLALSCQPGLPEALALGGVVSALTANSLTEALEAGALEPAPSAVISRPLFDCWLLMLRIVISLIDNLNTGESWSSPAARFVEEDVLGFARLYHVQLLAAFELPPSTFGEGPGAFVVTHDQRSSVHHGSRTASAHHRKDRLSANQLSAVRAAAQFFHRLCRAVLPGELNSAARRNPGMAALLSALTAKASLLLQQSVYLLQHPLQLKSLLQQDGQATGSGQVTGGALGAGRSVTVEEATRALRDVCGSVVSAFLTITGPELLFISEVTPAGAKRLVRPSLRTHPSEPASLGTLMDLSTHLTESLRKASGKQNTAGDHNEHLAAMLEQTLALCATQLTILLSGATTSNGSENTQAGGQQRQQRPVLNAMDEDEAAAAAAAAGVSSGLDSQASSARRDADAARREIEAGLARDLKAAIKDAKAAVAHALLPSATSNGASRAGPGLSPTSFLEALAAFTAVRLAPYQPAVEDEDD